MNASQFEQQPFEEQPVQISYPNFSAVDVEEVSAAQIEVYESSGDDNVEQTEKVMAPRAPQPKGKGKTKRAAKVKDEENLTTCETKPKPKAKRKSKAKCIEQVPADLFTSSHGEAATPTTPTQRATGNGQGKEQGKGQSAAASRLREVEEDERVEHDDVEEVERNENDDEQCTVCNEEGSNVLRTMAITTCCAPPISEMVYVCRDCHQIVDIKKPGVRLTKKTEPCEYQCGGCNKTGVIFHRCFGHWPLDEFKGIEKQDKIALFEKCSHLSGPHLEHEILANLCDTLVARRIEIRKSAEKCEFLPLTVWKTFGWDEEAINNTSAPEDFFFAV